MLPHLALDSLLIADNALWRGRVVEKVDAKDSEPVKRFNELMFHRSDFFTTIVPVGMECSSALPSFLIGL